MRRYAAWAAGAIWVSAAAGLAQPATAPAGEPNYLAVVRTFADTLLAKGLDVYGPRKTAMWCGVIDANDLSVPPSGVKPPIGVRPGDRCLGGSNLYQDAMTLRTFRVLSAVTGEDRYRQAAAAYIRDFLSCCQSPQTGLLGWGEHAHWNVFDDKATAPVHELLGWTPPWVELWEVDANATAAAIAGLRYHFHESPSKDFLFNRHASWGSAAYQKGGQPWIKHTSLYCYSFLLLYCRTGDEQWLSWARGTGGLYWDRRDPNTDLTEGCLGDPRETSRHATLGGMSLLSYWMMKAYHLRPRETTIRDRSLAMLKAIDRALWDGQAKAYRSAATTAGKAFPPIPHPWHIAYGDSSATLRFGRVAAYVARTEKDAECLEMARRAAGLVRASTPPPRYTPEAVGFALHLALDLYDLTKDDQYLADARRYARIGLESFWNGRLLVREVGDRYYESKTGAGDLLSGLLRLHMRLNKLSDTKEWDWSF